MTGLRLRWYNREALVRRENLCDECAKIECAFNDDGVCCYPLVHGDKPETAKDGGCNRFLLDMTKGDN